TMSQMLRSLTWVEGQRPKSDSRVINIQMLVDQLAEDPALLSQGEFVIGVINSKSDRRKHITISLQTEDMFARNTARIIHLYSKNDEEKEYDGFEIFPERNIQTKETKSAE
ncbi:hypothetical protein DM02DRAFT_473031, partial [Periconia macrospinosa]